MSIDATRWAWMRKGLRPLQKLILLSLADRADADDCCFPSKAALVDDTGVDIKSAWLALKELQEQGFIVDTGTRRGRTKQIHVWRLVGVEHRHGKRSENGILDGAESIPETEAFQKRKDSVFPGKAFQKRNTEPTREPEEEDPPCPPARPVSKQPSAPGFVLPSSIAQETWDEFEQHRRDIRKPLTNAARAKNAAVLAPLTPEQQQSVVDTTIANRWTGLFPPRANSHATDRRTSGQRFRAAAEASLAEHWDDPDPAGFRA